MVLKLITEYGLTVDNKLTVLWEMHANRGFTYWTQVCCRLYDQKEHTMLCRAYQLLEHSHNLASANAPDLLF